MEEDGDFSCIDPYKISMRKEMFLSIVTVQDSSCGTVTDIKKKCILFVLKTTT
jgi:hypothetical protein